MRHIVLSSVLAVTLAGCAADRTAIPVPEFDEATRTAHVSLQREMVRLESRLPADGADDHRAQAVEVLGQMAALDREHPKPYTNTRRLFSGQPELSAETMDSFGSTGPGRAFGRAMLDLNAGRDPESIAGFNIALTGYQELDHLTGQAYVHAWLVYALTNVGDYAEARRSGELGYALYLLLEDPKSATHTISALARLDAAEGHYDEALSSFRRALAVAQQQGDVDAQIIYLDSIGETARAARRTKESLEALEKSLALQEDSANYRRRNDTLISLARTLDQAGLREESLAAYGRAIEGAREAGDEENLAHAEYTVAYEGYLEHDEFHEAADRLRAVLARYRSLPEGPKRSAGEIKTLVKLSSALLNLGRLGEARSAAEAGVQLAIEIRSTMREARFRLNLVRINYVEGKLTRALTEQQAVLPLVEGPRRRELRTISLKNLGAIYYQLGKRDLAEDYGRRALELARETGDRHQQALTLEQLAAMLADAGRADEALEHQAEALGLWKELTDTRQVASNRLGHSLILERLGRTDEAIRQVDRAIADLRRVGDAEGHVRALNTKADFLGRSDRPALRREALALFTEALKIAEERGLEDAVWAALAGRATTRAALGRLTEARADYLSAIDVLEGQRARIESEDLQVRFFAARSDIYDAALQVELALAAGSADPAAGAFLLSERSRARSLLDLLSEATQSIAATVPPDLLRRETKLRDAVHEAAVAVARATTTQSAGPARETLRAAREALNLFEVELRRQVPRYAELVSPHPTTLAEVQSQVLDPGETLLGYHLGREASVLWAVRADGVTRYTLPAADEIAGLVAAYVERAGAAGAGRDIGRAEAEALATALLPEGAVAAGHRLLIAPDGPLHHLPFAGLVRDGRHLIEDHAIVVIPSATALSILRTNPTAVAPGGMLGIGAPDVLDPQFPALPYSERALQDIAGMFPPRQRKVLTGPAATREALEALDLTRFRYLHFATHGWLDPDDPGRSGLVLSAAEPGAPNEFLFTSDVFGLRMASQLVVLAACRSGAGGLVRGEGLMGMSRAFLYAGARGLVVSQWDVNDRSTAEFMRAFYARLVTGQDAASALRDTQIAFIRSDRPAQRQAYRWAPFVLIGDPGD